MSDIPIHQGTDEIDSWIDRYVTSRLAFKRETTKTTYALKISTKRRERDGEMA